MYESGSVFLSVCVCVCVLTCILTWTIKDIGVLLEETRGGNADYILFTNPEGHNGAQFFMLILKELMQAACPLDINQIAISEHRQRPPPHLN